jgi:nucleotide-binding universal stress UspA family protein
MALVTATDLARECRARLRLIAVAPLVEELQPMRIAKTVLAYARYQHRHLGGELDAAARAVADDVGTETALTDGTPAGELANARVELDLLVVGSRGYGPARRVLLGGVSHAVVTQAPCPVIVVPRGAGRATGEPASGSAAVAAGTRPAGSTRRDRSGVGRRALGHSDSAFVVTPGPGSRSNDRASRRRAGRLPRRVAARARDNGPSEAGAGWRSRVACGARDRSRANR